MGLFSGLSESVVSGILCNYFRRYAGPQCRDLKLAIQQNVDLYQLWVDNAESEGVRGPREVRSWARMFPKVESMVTPANLKRWLREQGMGDIARTVESTAGGEEWLAWQITRFKVGLWAK
jgi:hypothetical protein